jgi:hypothetical protein
MIERPALSNHQFFGCCAGSQAALDLLAKRAMGEIINGMANLSHFK